MVKEAELNWLEDGTPESSVYGDIYFSRENGLEESSHVFLQGNCLPEAWHGSSQFCVAELGFGTGLNFVNTAMLWSDTGKGILHYVAFEKNPLSGKTIRKALSSWPELSNFCEQLVNQLPDQLPGFHRIVFKDLRIFLTLVYGDANLLLPQLQGKVDAWYLDGFAPAKNPELWSESLFKKIALKSNPGATAATFSAARIVKDSLSAAGFEISLKKGFGKKRDMLVAKFPGVKQETSTFKNVAIIGAGLAGCLSSLALSYRGIKNSLFESAGNFATEASGAAAGVIMPYLSSSHSLRSEFFLNSFGFSWRQVLAESFYSRCGVLRLALGATQEKTFLNFASLNLPKNFAQALEASEFSELLGLKVQSPGFYFSSAGWISPKDYCKYAIKESERNKEFNFKLNTEVARLERSQDLILLYDRSGNLLGEFSKIIFANAYAAKKFFPTLPIKLNRGQILQVKTTPTLSHLKHVFCHQGYLMPEQSGTHLVGASYDHHSLSLEEDKGQSADLLNKLYRNLPEISDLELVGFRVGFRTTTADRMPIIGEIEPGVFVNIAHGSRGLVSCGIAGEVITGMINNEPLAVGAEVLSEISFSRFKSF